MTIPTIINFKDLISLGRIFEVTPSPQGNYIYLSFVFGFFLLAGLTVWFLDHKIEKNYRKIFSRVTALLITAGTTGLILIFLRSQQIPYLGSRFLMDFLDLVILFWIVQIILYWRYGWRQEIQKKLQKENFRKYLPKNYKL